MDFFNISDVADDEMPLLPSQVRPNQPETQDAEQYIASVTNQEHTGHIDTEGKFTPLTIEPGDHDNTFK